MTYSALRWITLAMFCLLVCSCSNSIHNIDDIGSDQTKAIFVDAKQRAITTAMRPVKREVKDKNGTITTTFVESYRTFCSEPNPDVFSVLSQAASGSAMFDKGPTAASASLQAAFSNSETGSTIPRTQTVNLLGQILHSTCERYLAGALDELQFPIQAVRDQHVIVSILAIEQLTGAVTPRTVALSATGNAMAGQSFGDAMVRLDDAWKAQVTADGAQLKAQNAYDELENAAPKCSELSPKVEKKDTLTTDEQAKWTKCSDAQAALNKANADKAAAHDHYASLKSVVDKGGTPVSASTAADAKIGSDQPEQQQQANIAAVAQAVTTIVHENFQQDEFLLFCIRAMSTSTNSDIETKCLEYVKSAVTNQQVKLKEETQKLQQQLKLMQ